MEDTERQHLHNEIARRDETIARLTAEIALHRQTIDSLCRRIFGASSEKIDPAQLELMLGADLARPAPAAEAPGAAPDADLADHKKKVKPQPRQPRIPEHLPVIEETLDPPEVGANPSAYRRIGEEVREQLHFKRAEFLRIRLIRGKFVRIDEPLAKPVIAQLPPSLQERCIATPALIAEVVDNRFTRHQPYYRQEEMFAGLGVTIHRKTLCNWALLASDWLSSIYREIEYEHWRARYRQFDETPIDYLQPGSGKAQTGYLWVSNIPGGSVLFHWHDGRGVAGINKLMGTPPELTDSEMNQLVRIIQCDGYVAYTSYAKDKSWIILMACHAHVRRKFVEAANEMPRLIAWILRQIGHLYHIEAKLREAKAGPALREAKRAAQSVPIHRRLKKFLDKLALRRSILPKSLLGQAIAYALGQWSRLEVYLTDGRVEIDNNSVENSIRPTKLGARNWLFVGNDGAGQKCAILYTIVENCRRLGIVPRDYLEDVLTRLPGIKANEVAALTPAAWLKARCGKGKRRVA